MVRHVLESRNTMLFNFKAWLFHSSSFCFCIPVRAGFVLMSILTFLLSGAISIIIWFEIIHSQLIHKERIAFFSAGIVETLLFVASAIGFIGVVARKQLFVMIYAYFLYVHFAINIIVGIYFLVTVRASNRPQLINSCAEAFADTSVESSCSRLTSVPTYVFIAIVAALLLLEFYGVLIAVRYVYRLRTQKRDDRSRRLGYFHAFCKPETASGKHTRQASDNIELLHSQESTSDTRDFEDAGVLDIRPRNYTPVPTYDRDWPPVPTPGSSLSTPDSLSDTTSSRRIRALPPLPVNNTASSATPEMSDRTRERVVLPGRLPDPDKPSSHTSKRRRAQTPDSEDERRSLYTTEVSSTTHSALMDHASYMRSTFSSPSPVPNFSSRSLR